MLTLTRLFVIVLFCFTSFKSEAAQLNSFVESKVRISFIQNILSTWVDYAKQHCKTGKHDPSFCDVVVSYQAYQWSNAVLETATLGDVPDIHLPNDQQATDLVGLNWYSDAFSTESKHEAIILAILINEISKSALEKALGANIAAIDKLSTSPIYRHTYNGPSLKAYLKYSHPFLQVFMAAHSSAGRKPDVNLQSFYVTLHEKMTIFSALHKALTDPSAFPMPELDQVRQVYTLTQFVHTLRNLPLNRLINLLQNRQALNQIEGLETYLTQVKDFTRRDSGIDDTNRINVYRSIALLNDVLSIVESIPRTNTTTIMTSGQSEIFDDFLNLFVTTQTYFSEVENAIPKN